MRLQGQVTATDDVLKGRERKRRKVLVFEGFLKIEFRKRKGDRERNIDLLFPLFMHSLVDFCTCPDRGSNPQPWCIGLMLQPSELPGQGRRKVLKIIKKTEM